MGHKVHPVGFRLGVVKGWQARWYAERDYKDVYSEDRKIRTIVNKELANAAVSRIEIERAAANQVLIKIYTAKPGIVIGKSGEKVERLKATLEAQTKKRVRLDINEIRQPDLDAYLVARGIAEQLERRISFRRAMKQAVQKSMRANAKGVKVICGGRLGGAEIARSEKEVEGKVPLHTLRADIDYGLAEAHTTFGVIGIKVWIYRGDILPSKRREPGEPPEMIAQPTFTPREGGDRRDRGPRPQGDRPRGDRGDRGERSDRGGDRGPRPQGDRPRVPRPQGDRPQGQSGERGPRPQGDRPPREPRPQGDRPQGERVPRPQGDRPQGQGGERGPRPQGDRPPREPRPQGDRPQGERVPRPQGDRPPREPRPQGDRPQGERATQAPGNVSTPPTPPTPPVPDAGNSGTTQSE